MKSLTFIFLLFYSTSSFSQVKVEVKEKSYLYLLTDTYEISESTICCKTYYHKFFWGAYEYPTIQQGYYSISMFTDINGLVKYYTELSNLETLEDGVYELSMTVSKHGNIYATKKGTKVKLTTKNSFLYYGYKKFSFEDIKLDLKLITEIQDNKK